VVDLAMAELITDIIIIIAVIGCFGSILGYYGALKLKRKKKVYDWKKRSDF